MSWVTNETGHRCTRHGTSFPRGEVCKQCTSDAGPAIVTDGAPAADASLAARITTLREKAASLWAVYVDLIDGDDAGIAIKAVAEHTKIERLAEELQDRADAREHDLKLIQHEREMSGLRRSN